MMRSKCPFLWLSLSLPLLLLILLPFLIIDRANSADISRCPPYQQYFQKTLGYRPDFQLIGNTHDLFPLSAATDDDPNASGGGCGGGAYAAAAAADCDDGGPRRDAINVDCWQRCYENVECGGYVLFLNVSQCFGVTQTNRSSRFYTPTRSRRLLLDTNAVYFEKICLTDVPDAYRNKMWLFTKIPGSSLESQSRKSLGVLVSRIACAQACMLEQDFNCLSTTFLASYRNNRVRFDGTVSDRDDDLGTCDLSDKDKSSLPDAFRVSNANEEYIENECAPRPVEQESCAYETYPHSRLRYADVEYDGITRDQCMAQCDTETRFYCQGVSYGTYEGNVRCLLHSEDVISMGPRALLSDWDFEYDRRVKCLNVTVMCSRSQMLIQYYPDYPFNGRLYVHSHSDECTSLGTEDNAATLRIAIGNADREQRCGILRAYQIDNAQHINRTLLTTLVVVQANAIVQTQGDRLVKVGCIIDNNVDADGHIGDVSLASSLGVDDTDDGTTPLFNTTGTAPRVHMRIVDLTQPPSDGDSADSAPVNNSTCDVVLGQNLELQIVVEPPDSPYDIRATSLVARSDAGQNSILLLDSRGCAADTSVFPAMQRRYVPATATQPAQRMLFARFHAFKFAGSGYVNFEVVIQFCRNECADPLCGVNLDANGLGPVLDGAVNPRRRRRRRRDSETGIRYAEPITVIAGATSPSAGQQQQQQQRLVYDTSQGDDVHRQNITERNQIHVDDADSSGPVVSQRVLGRLANEIQDAAANTVTATNGTQTANVRDSTELRAVPLRVQLNVHTPDAPANSESLIYGQSQTASNKDSLLAAGVGASTTAQHTSDSGSVCINRMLIILLCVLWLVLQTILIVVCTILIRRYKKIAEAQDDQRALQTAAAMENFGFGDVHRRVRWADQGRSRVLMFT